MVEQFHKTDRDVNERVPVVPTRLDQDDPGRRVFGEAICQYAAGRAGAHDHVVGFHYCAHPRDFILEQPNRGTSHLRDIGSAKRQPC
jgi:hypothetical protein